MKHLHRLAALALAFTTSHGMAAPGDELLGCWSARRVISHLQDGSTQEFMGQACTMQVQPGRIVTRCDGIKGGYSYEYRYEMLKPGLYRAQMPATGGRPASVKDYHYEVSGERLRITTYPSAAASAPTAAVKLVSESERTPCPR
jgi:hypothetical protein